jgi:hypothetical protein
MRQEKRATLVYVWARTPPEDFCPPTLLATYHATQAYPTCPHQGG